MIYDFEEIIGGESEGSDAIEDRNYNNSLE
jgi:hypothetical protein